MIVNIHEAKTQFSKLIAKFQQGEEIIVAKNGKPIFKFAPVDKALSGQRPVGFFNYGVDLTHFEDPVDGFEEYQ